MGAKVVMHPIEGERFTQSVETSRELPGPVPANPPLASRFGLLTDLSG